MATNLDVKKVTAVLLATGWSTVVDRSFEVHDNLWYEKQDGRQTPVASTASGTSAGVATWKTERNDMITCPLASIIAVKWS